MDPQRNVLQPIHETIAKITEIATRKYPEKGWMFQIQADYWGAAATARERGLPLILHSQSFPPELIYALGGVPLCLDSLGVRLASMESGVAKYVDIAQQYIPDHLCAINKAGIGIALSGELPPIDALLYAATPCDSTRIAYPLIAEHLQVPSFCVDSPYRQDARGYEYIGRELREAAAFISQVTGKSLERDSLVRMAELSNAAYELVGQIAALRKRAPCPLPSKLLILNEMIGAMAGSPELVAFLEGQLLAAQRKTDVGEGHLAQERHRIAWIQNPIWFDVGVYDWMEKEYGAVVTMDAFGYQDPVMIRDPRDEDEIYRGLGERLLKNPMVHRSSGPTEYWIEVVTKIVREYSCDAAVFAGHVGCKHTWAVSKVIKDVVIDRLGIPILVFDVDGLDSRYRSSESIKAKLRDFLEMLG